MKHPSVVCWVALLALMLLLVPTLGSGQLLAASATKGVCKGVAGSGGSALVPFMSTLYPYCIDYPAGWRHVDTQSGDQFSAPSLTDGVRDSVLVLSHYLPSGITAASYLRLFLGTSTLHADGTAVAAGRRIALMNVSTKQGGSRILIELAALALGGRFWLFELIIAPIDLTTLRPAFVSMLSTFRALPPPVSSGTWTILSAGTDNALSGVSCPSALQCVAVGDGGTILTSADGGATWTTRTSGTAEGLDGVSCPNVSLCVAVGNNHTILTSADGGVNWMSRTSGASSLGVAGVSCPSALQCVAVGESGTILTSADGGVTWTTRAAGTNDRVAAVSCPTVSLCVAVSWGIGGSILTSSNGGSTWTSRFTSTQNQLFGVTCETNGLCLATGNGGALLASSDNGATWNVRITATYDSLNGVSCTSTRACFAVSDSGAVLSTVDGGTTWHSMYFAGNYNLAGISCPASRLCVVVGHGPYGMGSLLLQWRN